MSNPDKNLNPNLLDVVMREDDYVLYYGDKPLKTPGGEEVKSDSQRLLQHMIVEFILNRGMLQEGISGYRLYSFITDYLEKGRDFLLDNIDEVISEDPIARIKFGINSSKRLIPVEDHMEFLEKHEQFLNLIFQGVSVILQVINEFIRRKGLQNKDDSGDVIREMIKKEYRKLSLENKAVLTLLCSVHDAGIILPMLLVSRMINPAEYTNGLFALHMNFKQLVEDRKHFSEILSGSPYTKELQIDWENPGDSFERIHRSTLKALEFLSFFGMMERREADITELIKKGENYSLEFKSTLRWDLYQGKKNPAIEHASLKSIAAFLNSSGGNLLIGVRDDGSIEGVESDKFDNDDKFLLHLWNLIKSSMGQEVSSNVRTSLEKVNGRTVCRVKCLRSPAPVFLKQKGFDEEFFIRVGPSSSNLKIQEALKYISERFEG